MKKILMALALVTFAYTGAEAQNKKVAKAQEKCSLSADGKFVTCCKTMPNPAYAIKGKTADRLPVAVAPRKKAAVKSAVKLAPPRPARKTYYVKDYQVCKDEGGYYTCCLYENSYSTSIEPEY